MWLDLMRPSQYAAFLSDPETHAGMTADGRYTGGDVPGTCLIFDSLDEAVDYCRSRVTEAARLRCEVFDHEGKANPPVAVFLSPAFARALERAPRRQIRLGLILIALSPPLFWLDARARWGLILPTFLGLQLVLAGLRLIQLGYATSAASRHSRHEPHG